MSREHKRLYKVKVEYHLMVLARDKAEAKRDTLDNFGQAELMENAQKHLNVVCEVKNIGAVPPGWMERLPYGQHLSRLLENVTVREFIQRKLFNPFNRTKKGKKYADHQSTH